MERFSECFSELPDPRADNALHDLTEILFIALMATLCGATSCTDMALFARMKAYLWQDVLVLKNGLPSHDTFSRVFRMLDPDAFEKAFQRFMKAFAQGAKIKRPKGVIALDGKALRRGYERGKSHMPPVMVTAWAAQTRMALANVLAPDNNEAAGALQLLELLQLKGCVVTADALHCHRGMAKAIVARSGDYVLAVKGNQPALLADAKAAIQAAERKGKAGLITTDAAHGRKEQRKALIAPVKDMAQKHDFPGLKAVARITSKRGKDKTVERYFLMSQAYSPKDVLRIVRTHWTIENSLHWPLDVTLDEDLARNRKDNAQPTSPSSGALLSMSPEPTRTQLPPCAASSNAPDGTMPSSSNSSATCDSPAQQGGGNGSCDTRHLQSHDSIFKQQTQLRDLAACARVLP